MRKGETMSGHIRESRFLLQKKQEGKKKMQNNLFAMKMQEK